MFVGSVWFLLSFIHYKKNYYSTIDQRYPYPSSGWLDHRIAFKRLMTEGRKRYRQEGNIGVMIGLIQWLIAITAHFFILIH